ncbi:HAMP domain-containing sensor histidine kinase [Nocardioides sp. P86]|uniref:sensor histidine kinase n=1 Tax=Nocardioides sp. P86 TaxID=2939569 RepID=UPI00203FD781|nr:HAMP domain-containing sensor histidine kinase [Nocardioides sp. P86]MCM3515153.1 HAMP domain-containing histidine kinase [Nocardioides sp. P86]
MSSHQPPPAASAGVAVGRRWSWRRDDGSDAGTFRRQLVVSTAVLGALVAIALVVVVQIVLAGASTSAIERVLLDRADVVVQAASTDSTAGGLRVPDAALDPGVAVYDLAGSLIAGDVPPAQQEVFSDLSATAVTRTREVDDSYVVLGRPFTTTAGDEGVVVLTEPLGPYENDERTALLVSLSAGAVIVVLATALAGWASRRALAPVAQMAATAAEWSAHDLDRRFDLGPPGNEIRALGATLDGLLDRVRSTIRAEQRLSTELAHELRTPLTTIQATADLVAMRTDIDDELRHDVEQIQRTCRSMAGTVTSLLDLARTNHIDHDATCSLTEVLDDVLDHLATADQVLLDVPAGTALDLPHGLAVRVLSPVIANAVRVAQHVEVRADAGGGQVQVRVSDDGPGVPPAHIEDVFEPGFSTHASNGLGLALARRVARGAGGDLDLTAHGDLDGATFVATFPGRNPPGP